MPPLIRPLDGLCDRLPKVSVIAIPTTLARAGLGVDVHYSPGAANPNATWASPWPSPGSRAAVWWRISGLAGEESAPADPMPVPTRPCPGSRTRVKEASC
jgi:hypothetical protein